MPKSSLWSTLKLHKTLIATLRLFRQTVYAGLKTTFYYYYLNCIFWAKHEQSPIECTHICRRAALEIPTLRSGSSRAGGEKNQTYNIVDQQTTVNAKGSPYKTAIKTPYKTAIKTQDIKYAHFAQFQSSLGYQ